MLVGGRDVRQLQMASLRHAMASVPQDMVLFNDTIYYNIAYGNLSASREAVEAAAKAAQVWWYVCGIKLSVLNIKQLLVADHVCAEMMRIEFVGRQEAGRE